MMPLRVVLPRPGEPLDHVLLHGPPGLGNTTRLPLAFSCPIYSRRVLGRREPSFSSSRVSDVVTSGSWVSNPVSEKSMLKYVHFLILT